MKTNFKGQEASIEKIQVYCKSGAYEHKMKTGWGVVINGNVVLGDIAVNNGSMCDGAQKVESPKYKTRKELIVDAEYCNARYTRNIKKTEVGE